MQGRGVVVPLAAWIAVIGSLLVPTEVRGQTPSHFVEIELNGERWTGGILAQDGKRCWFARTDGRYDLVVMTEVTSFRPLSGGFRPESSNKLAETLKRQQGRDWEVAVDGPFVVVADRGRSRSLARDLKSAYAELVSYFRVRGMPLSSPLYPLVVQVCRDRDEFVRISREDGVTNTSLMRGYYSRLSNRILMYEREDDFVGTLTHELVHQTAFNCGLHERLADVPTWVSEGLATSLESPDARNGATVDGARDRLNPSRHRWFLEAPRQAGWLKRMLECESGFQSRPLDAYAQAWAVTFYLLERRPIDYRKYLGDLSQIGSFRDPPTPAERLDLFSNRISSRLDLLEVEVERFQRELTQR